jgi:hypothetical protein
MAQVVECLHKALSSNPGTAKKKKRKESQPLDALELLMFIFSVTLFPHSPTN